MKTGLIILVIALISVIAYFVGLKDVFFKGVKSVNSDTGTLEDTSVTHSNETHEFVVRNDSQGLGAFGAPRTHGAHQGIDIVQPLDQYVYTPFKLQFVRTGITSVSKPSPLGAFTILEHPNLSGYTLKAMYVDCSNLYVGQIVNSYEPIGFPDDLHKFYGSDMIQHVHFEIRDLQNNVIDPTSYFA